MASGIQAKESLNGINLYKMKTGITEKELATEVKHMVELLNEILIDAQKKGLKIDIFINTHYQNCNTVQIRSITQKL